MTRERVSVTRARFTALVHAASLAACSCALPETREHDGTCVSCWALSERLKHARKLASTPATFSTQELNRHLDASAKRELDRCEAEQRLRADQLPRAIRLIAEARAAESESSP